MIYSLRTLLSIITLTSLCSLVWADSEPWDEDNPFFLFEEQTPTQQPQPATTQQPTTTIATVQETPTSSVLPATTTPSTAPAQATAKTTPATSSIPAATILSMHTETPFWDDANNEVDLFDETLQVLPESANTPEEINALSSASGRSIAFLVDEPTNFTSTDTPNLPHPSRVSLRGNATPPVNTPRLYEGQFNIRRGIMNPNTSYKYMLTTPQGRRIAYLDMQDVLSAGPVDKYFDRKVIIQGIPERDGKTSALVIKAKALRLKES